jgi:uncharacterized protein (DUF488 family)
MAPGLPVKHPFFTIGHSTRSIDEFVGMLTGAGATFVVDVRRIPRSRTNPQYDREVLARSLEPFGIGYEHIAALGGLRGRDHAVPPDVNAYWRNASFHRYADYATGAEFRAGLHWLLELGNCRPCAVMCAEAVWWRCHRRIIADYLLAAGEAVFHIMGARTVEPAHLTDAARPLASGALTYAGSGGE